ncbi:metal-dependent hydrolase (plasmid) [Haladaptatus sp. SPP-AMP-3]|uniref:metal-dependent hydrolase n=1 Tax=Haladaptatus sp. SPP-AMP-3 TaxID=3121295 RepID=UPI003C2CE228
MWPWESAIFAYLCYSIYVHVRHHEPPGGAAVVVAAVASVVPDLIDKPLSWQYGVFRNGYALGHSVFVSLLVVAVAHAVARRSSRPRLGLAFGLGFLSHNVGDALEHMNDGIWYGVEHVLWPVVVLPPDESPGFTGTVRQFLGEYRSHLVHHDFTSYFALVGVISACTLLLWAYDDFPVARELLTTVRRVVR